MRIRGLIESRLRSRAWGSSNVGGHSFPPMGSTRDDPTVRAILALNAAVIELAGEVDKLASDVSRLKRRAA